MTSHFVRDCLSTSYVIWDMERYMLKTVLLCLKSKRHKHGKNFMEHFSTSNALVNVDLPERIQE